MKKGYSIYFAFSLYGFDTIKDLQTKYESTTQ